MFNPSHNQTRRGEGDKKSTPCKFFLMGTCNKGNNCPYSHTIPRQNQQQPEGNTQAHTKKQHHSRFERTIGKINGKVTALEKASNPYLFIAGSSNNCYTLYNSELNASQPGLSTGPITAIEVFSDLYYIASAATPFKNSIIRVCQPTTNNELTLEGEKANIVKMQYTSDYNILFVAYDNGSIHCWNLTDAGFSNVANFTFNSAITCFVYVDSMLIVGLRGGNIGIISLNNEVKQESHIAESDILNLHVVDFEGVKQLIVVFEGGHIGAYSIGDFNQIHMDSMNARIFASCVCQTLNQEWMLVTSCEAEGKKPVLSVLKLQTFEKKGLIYDLPSAAVCLTNLGKVGNAGDYIVAGCVDGSLQLYNLSH